MIIQIEKELEAKKHFCTLGAGADNSNGEIFSITGSYYQFITLNICCRFQKESFKL